MNALPADRGVTKRVLGAEGVCAHPGSVSPLCKLLPAEFSLLHFFKEIKRLDLQPPNHKKKKARGTPLPGAPITPPLPLCPRPHSRVRDATASPDGYDSQAHQEKPYGISWGLVRDP